MSEKKNKILVADDEKEIAVSVLSTPAPECAQIIQGTIAAAAVINEIIAVFIAKKGFEWAGELNKAEKE